MFKKKKCTTFFYINIITLFIELVSIYMIYKSYIAIYRIEYLITACVIQISWIIRFFKSDDFTLNSKKLPYFWVISFILLITYLNLPNYSYKQGSKLLINHLKDTNFEICDLPFNEKTTPSTDKYSNILISNKKYCYKLRSFDEYKYFSINPETGEIIELQRK